MYTLEKRKLIYIMTRKMVYWHTHCITPWKGTPIFFEPSWVVHECELCKMNVESQDWWNNCSYNSSQKRLFDDMDSNKKYWY